MSVSRYDHGSPIPMFEVQISAVTSYPSKLSLDNRGYPLDSAPVGKTPLSPGPVKPAAHVSSSPVASKDVHIKYTRQAPRIKSGDTGTRQLIYEEDECRGDPFLLLLDHSLYSAPIVGALRRDHIQGSMSDETEAKRTSRKKSSRKGRVHQHVAIAAA